MERSLYLRALNNMFDLLEHLYLHPNRADYHPEDAERHRHGSYRFHQAATLVTKAVEYRSGEKLEVPYPIHKEGNA